MESDKSLKKFSYQSLLVYGLPAKENLTKNITDLKLNRGFYTGEKQNRICL